MTKGTERRGLGPDVVSRMLWTSVSEVKEMGLPGPRDG